MTNLIVYPSFLCPFACAYCLFKDKLSLNEKLSLETLDNFLQNNHENIDNIIISGGDPLSLDKSYFESFLNVLRKYNKNITLQAYPYTLNNTKYDDLHYDFSYDFIAKSMANEAWCNLIDFKKDFKLTVTLSPALFNYHPNNILKKLSFLPHLKEVEFVPYYKNNNSQYDITRNDSLNTITKMILSSQLSLPFKLTNKERLIQIVNKSYTPVSEVCLFSNGKTYEKYFENDILRFKEIANINDVKPLSIPSSQNIYNEDIIKWFSSNGV